MIFETIKVFVVVNKIEHNFKRLMLVMLMRLVF